MRRSLVLLPLMLLIPLAGCVGSLLGGGKPARLYRLERSGDRSVAVSPTLGSVVIQLQAIRFAPGIEGDRILMLAGQQALYLKGARWVANAPELFGQTLHGSFARRAPELLLIDGHGPKGAASLQITVTHFEAVYAGGAGSGPEDAPPLVRIEAEALLLRAGNREIIGQQRFVAEVPAAANRVGPIVEAFGKASDEVAARLTEWSRTSVNVK